MSESQQPSSQFQMGTHPAAIDGKGRSGMPQVLRRLYGDSVVIVKQRGKLKVMTPGRFEGLARELSGQFSVEGGEGLYNFLNDGKQSLLAYVFANAYECGFNTQGRLTIPKVVRQQMGLTEDMPVRWRGLGKYAELLVGGVEQDEKADCARVEEESVIDHEIDALLPSPVPSAQDKDPGSEGETGDE